MSRTRASLVWLAHFAHRCWYWRRPLIAATPPQPWEQHARPDLHDDDETDPHTTPGSRNCQGMP